MIPLGVCNVTESSGALELEPWCLVESDGIEPFSVQNHGIIWNKKLIGIIVESDEAGSYKMLSISIYLIDYTLIVFSWDQL